MRLWLLFVLLPWLAFSQGNSNYQDSLEQVIATQEKPAAKEALFLLAEHLEFKEPVQADSLAQILLSDYINPKDSSDIMRLNFIRAASNRWQGNYAPAIEYYLINHAYFTRQKDSLNIAKAGHFIGDLSSFMGKNVRAQTYLLEVADIYSKMGSAYQVADINSSLAGLYFTLEQYEKASEAYLESLQYFTEKKDTSGMATVHANLGYLYTEMEDFERAEYHLLEDRKFNDYFSTQREAAFNYDFMGYLRQREGKIEEAYKEYTTALTIRRKLSSTYNLCESLNSVGSILNDLGRYDEAISHLEEVLSYEEHDSEYQRLTAHFNLYKAYKGKGDFEQALFHYKTNAEISDSIDNKERYEIIAEKDAAYQKQEQDATIRLLSKQQEVSKAKLGRSQILLFASIFGLLALGAFSYFAYKTKQNIKAKNIIINKSLEEKELLMREIHHRVKNNLQTISSLLNLQSKYVNDENALEAIQKGRDRVQSMAILHNSLYSDGDITTVDMRQYFKNLARSIFNSYHLTEDEVKLHLKVEDVTLDVDSVVPIGLITNELITNSLKHAFSDAQACQAEIHVQLKESEEQFELLVKDNGVGLSEEVLAGEGKESFGQRMIDAFAKKLKATVNVRNTNGTEVEIFIPKTA